MTEWKFSSSTSPNLSVHMRIHPYAFVLMLGKGMAILCVTGAAACFAWSFWSTVPWSVVWLLFMLILSLAVVFADSMKGKTP